MFVTRCGHTRDTCSIPRARRKDRAALGKAEVHVRPRVVITVPHRVELLTVNSDFETTQEKLELQGRYKRMKKAVRRPTIFGGFILRSPSPP